MFNAIKHRDGFRPKLIALSVAACFSVSATQVSANPTGGTVASGSASFASSGNTLTITNSANAIINWQNFSIGVNEITRFLQSSGSSAVLNRVVGANGVIPQSVIDGILSSNGRVFLLNSSGIVIGANARIDVAGFVASSLNLSDADFLAGRMRFTETPGAGGVSNAGVIDTSTAGPGGRVFLVGPDVQNSGIIRTPQGEIILAAGKSVELVSENSPFVTVNLTADSEQALNVGQLLADSGRIGMFGALVRQGGVAEANSAVVGANGEIRLVATQNVTLDAGSVTSASGGSQGGNVQVSAPVVVQASDIRADGDAGGNIQIDASNFLQAGTLSASGSAGPGGTIAVTAPHVIQTASAVMAADSSGGNGGSISVDASGATDGLLFSSAKYSATGDMGGNITLLGHDILLLGASADASGASGGGTILVGGDLHGANPAVANASTTGVNFSTTLKADATQNGDGGKIVVWSDNNTQFYGTASARGGAQSGNGGSMEISGRDSLTMGGFADAGAVNGTPGSVLLDPKNIIIDSNAGGSGTLGSFQLVDPHPGANELFGQRTLVLPNQNVVVTDPNDSFGGAVGAGAVYLFNSSTGALTSALTGSSLNDHVGAGLITTLPSGNYLIGSPAWNNGAATGAGAVTFASGTTGVSGTVSATNSLVGSTTNDSVGSQGVALLSNGNYVVISPNWSNGAATAAGAVTAGSGTTGVVGQVTAANSLVGTTAGDNVGNFGITPLSGGSYVVDSAFWNNGAATHAGAVTFVNGTTGLVGPVSATNSLVGTTTNDQVGSFGVTELNNGNYVVLSANWANGPTALGAGAVTFGSGATGVVGAVSSANSLVGSTTNDQVGIFGLLEFSNGNYLVLSPRWNNGAATQAGAVTLVNGSNGSIVATGAVGGTVSATTSLVGTSMNDQVGESVTVINNSGVPTGYVVNSPSWDTLGGILNVGAVTFGNSAIPVVGTISSANSLVGTTLNDQVGSGGVLSLTNGNYVVDSPNWSNAGVTSAGAVTLGSGTTGLTGTITSSNSLVGTTAFDSVGNAGVRPLTNGNYVVLSPNWSNAGVGSAGAVTLGNGATGITGPVSATNSLVGTTLNDQVGSNGITELTNGNYVVSSPGWNNSVGAVTFGSETTGVVGAVSATNSLVGSTTGDVIGSGGIIPLFNGNYVVNSPTWSDPVTQAASVGAVTFGSGTTGVAGTVSAANSLVGTTAGDQVGSSGITPLFNGNYVVASPNWSNGAATLAGAATFGDGTIGVVGAVSATNSLVGTTANDQVGSRVTPLFINDNYVVSSPNWNNNAGAVTFGSGTTGIAGLVSSGNSLVGSTTGLSGDRIGSGNIIELPNGNYLVVNSQWNNSVTGAAAAGAVTWVNGTNGNATGQTSPGAVISASNSLVGGTTNDQVGDTNSCECTSLFLLPGGNFVIRTLNWTNPLTAAGNAGAVSFGSGTTGISGLITSANSIIGSSINDQIGSGGIFPLINSNFVVSSPNAANGALAGAGLVNVVTPGTSGTGGAPATGQTFSSNPGADVTITPSAIEAITNTGTALVLQANNDITLNPGSDVVTSAGGTGGALTLQAGRSVVLNSSITTDNGAMTIVANERAANGVIDANRDPGAATITMAAGTTINAGTGNISLTLNDGTGLTNPTSGNIVLASLTSSGLVSVQNLGPTATSGILTSGGAVSGGSVALTATNGAIGSPTAGVEVVTPTLSASAANGITLDLNGLAPQPAVVNLLQNSGIGDILLNAHGGATTTSLVSNPGGNVFINTFSPLDVSAGISAGNSIFLSTSGGPTGSANDMSLNGTYTYNTSTGAFEVTVGLGGQLTLLSVSTPLILTAPLFPNPVNITRFTFVEAPTESPQLDTNTVIQGTNQLILGNNAPSAEDLQKRNEDAKKKKEAVVCK
jgi:filamentous hemagglutinin family protein